MYDVQFSWIPALCVTLYGLGSWITVNGLWVELPLLVNSLPEGWNLPSYLSIIIQLANLGPLAYVPLTKICRSSGPGFCAGCLQPPERLANYTILTVGFLSCILLASFWKTALFLPGISSEKHSLGLLSLALCSSLVDCTSSVTFVAYLTGMPEAYMGALTFGEAFSDIVPSAIALVQGVGGDPECVNITVNGTMQTIAQYPPPRFSISLYMYFLSIIMGICLIAFGALDLMPWGLGRAVRRRYRTFTLVQSSCSPTVTSPISSSATAPNLDPSPRRRRNRGPDDTLVHVAVVRSDFLSSTGASTQEVMDEDNIGVSMPADPANRQNSEFFSTRILLVPVFLLSYSCLLTFGLLPGFQSYSTASYNATTYHLAAALSGLSCALAVIIATYLFHRSKTKSHSAPVVHEILDKTTNLVVASLETPPHQSHSHLRKSYGLWILLTLLFSVPAGYILYLAHASPNPPQLRGTGPFLAVLSWILVRAGFGGLRTWWWLYLSGHSGEPMTLRLAGLATQMGAAVGAVISFLLIVYFRLFQSKVYC